MAAAQLDVAIGADHQQARRAQLVGEELEQQQRGRRPSADRPAPRPAAAGATRAEEHRVPSKRRKRACSGSGGGGGASPAAGVDLGHQSGEVGGGGTQVSAAARAARGLEPRPHHLHPGPERRCARALVAAAPQHAAPRCGVGGELLSDARLADARLAGQAGACRPSGQRVLERGAQPSTSDDRPTKTPPASRSSGFAS